MATAGSISPASTRAAGSPQLVILHVQANGVQAYLTTLGLFFLGWQLQLFSPSRVYDLFGEILSALNIFSLLFCAFLYFKVRQWRKGTGLCLQ